MKHSKYKNQKGFSMVELLVVMGILLIVLSSVFSLMRATIVTAHANYQMTDANQNLRIAHEFLTRDLLSAGDGVKDDSSILLPPAFVTKYLTTDPNTTVDPNVGRTSIGMIISDNDLQTNTQAHHSVSPTYLKERTDRISILENDTLFIPIDIPKGSTDFLTGRVTVPGGTSDFAVGEIYYLTAGGTATFGTITSIDSGTNSIYFGSGDIYGLNRSAFIDNFSIVTVKDTQAVVLKRVKIIQYFVDTNDRLIRRTFGVKGKGIDDNIIAEHIPNLQFNYILKPASSDDTKIFDKPVSQVALSQQSLIRLVEPSIVAETANFLQDGEKYQVEGKVQLSIRNIQFLDVADVTTTTTTN